MNTPFFVAAQPRALCCAFSGHRDLSAEALRALQPRMEQVVTASIAKGYRHFLAGGAMGFDMLAAITVLNLQFSFPYITLSMILPCPAHDEKWDFAKRGQLQTICKRATEVLYTAEHYHRGCMMIRNRYLIDHSAALICYCARKSGGTAATLQMAEKNMLTIQNLADIPMQSIGQPT